MTTKLLRKIWFIISTVMLCIFTASTLAEANMPSNQLIRIAYAPPEINDLEFLPITQIYKAYLDEIAKYADWRYEMVAVPPDQILDKLQNGEIDLALPIEYDPLTLEKGLVYSQDDLFYDVLCFYARNNDERYGVKNIPKPQDSNIDLRVLNGAKIGFLNDRSNTMQPNLTDFFKTSRLAITPVYYDDVHVMEKDLLDGRLDLMADTITRSGAEFRQLMPFSIVPARLVTIKSKQYLIDKVNYAVRMSRSEDINVLNNIKRDFIENTLLLTTHFTSEEWDFIHNTPPINVVLYNNQDPFLEYDENNIPRGIYPDIMNYLSILTGLKFNYIHAENYNQAEAMLSNGLADMMIDIYNSGTNSTNFYFTNHIYVERFAVIGHTDTNASIKPDTLIIPHPLPSMMHFVQEQLPGWNIITTIDTSTALNAANINSSAVAMIEFMSLQSDRFLMLYPKLAIVPTATINIPVSIAISKHKDVILRSILNKGIVRLDSHKLDEIILRHTMQASPHLSLSHFIYYYPLQICAGVIFSLLIIFILAFTLYRYNNNYIQKKILAEKNAHLEKVISDLSVAHKERDDYKYMAEIDGLTGVYNKVGIEELCRAEFLDMDINHSCCAFFIIDLDHFKQLNDTCGHQKGDEILKDFASVLKTIVRKDDYIGRFGGDEFILLLRNLQGYAAIDRIATTINQAARKLDHGESPYPITASIGIAIAPKHACTYEDIFSCADNSVYMVKENGRDGYCIYSEDVIHVQ